jgi:NTE family protein
MAQEMDTLLTNKKPIGLCLSGGGALGFAHIGVLQALEDNGIRPQCLSGSSMGAIVATLYAAGYSPDDMMKLIKDGRLFWVTKLITLKPVFWKSGWSDQSTVRTLIKDLIPHNSFENLSKKLFICVANLNTAKWEIKDRGKDLDFWVSASASIPGVFEALKLGDDFYVDGGLFNNFPAQPLKNECENIIGVDVLPLFKPKKIKKPVDSIVFSIRAAQAANSYEGRSLCQFIFEPGVVRKFNEFRFNAYQKIYDQGYKEAVEYIKRNPEILNLKAKE